MTVVHAQGTDRTGSEPREVVYRVPFATVAAARRFCVGARRPTRAVMVTPTRVVCFDNGKVVSQEVA